jgi:hypothetical protein
MNLRDVNRTGVNKERVQLVVDALRSDEFQQGQGVLRNWNTHQHCCLGVATEVALRSGFKAVENRDDYFNHGIESLHEDIAEWYGFKDHHGWVDQDPDLLVTHPHTGEKTLIPATEVNDWLPDESHPGFTFQDIATAFERTYIEEAQA